FWQALFLEGHPTLAVFWGPLIGPLVAIVSFVCSVGNVPLAAVLWNGHISFGGVVAFIFADLIVLPILDIYRRYYGWRMALYLLDTLYLAMAVAGLLVEFLFRAVGLVPSTRQALVTRASIGWNADTVLDVVFLLVTVALVWRFSRTGGTQMMQMMDRPGNAESSIKKGP
ncbi:MAG: permease, partial [Chloroflexota bacterium]|nr:permease [Chloroflexota bacterium]